MHRIAIHLLGTIMLHFYFTVDPFTELIDKFK